MKEYQSAPSQTLLSGLGKGLSASRKLFCYIKSFIYTEVEFFIYKNINEVEIKSPAIVRKANKGNVNDAITFNSKAIIKTFNKFLDSGEKGYLAYLDSECVHRSWVKRGPHEVRFMHDYVLSLQENDVYVHHCATAERFRGMNIYPLVLMNICKDHHEKNVYILVLKRKYYANRGVEKAGFKKARHVIIKRILGFTRVKETMLSHEL